MTKIDELKAENVQVRKAYEEWSAKAQRAIEENARLKGLLKDCLEHWGIDEQSEYMRMLHYRPETLKLEKKIKEAIE